MPRSDQQEIDIPEEARLCWETSIRAEGDLRDKETECLKYRAGEQWDPKDINKRGRDRPAVVINLLEQPITQVVNSNVANRPGGQVTPGDEAASPEVAEVLQGRIRHIEYVSNANVAVGTMIDYASAAGRGMIGLTIDWISPDSADQELRIREIKDPAQWRTDPNAQERDKSDARWRIGRQKISRAEFKERFPDKQIVDVNWGKGDSTASEWVDPDDVWIAEYWKLTTSKKKVYRYPDGTSGVQKQRGGKVVRISDYPSITQYLISAVEVLDETPWLGKRIPLYDMVPKLFYVEGKPIQKSQISDSLVPQKMYNFSESLKMEAMALAPKPKWVMTRKQVEGYEDEWKTANNNNEAALFYNNEADESGTRAAPPEWKIFAPPIEVFENASLAAKDDVRATSGLGNTALGEFDTKRQSGEAVRALQSTAGQGTQHITEALGNTLKPMYQDIIEIDPLLNKGPRSVPTRSADGKQKLVRVNDKTAQKPLMLSDGRYGVIVSTGPSQESQQQAAADFLGNVQQHDPAGWALVRDIGAEIQEPYLGPFARELAKRWIPPQFAQQDPSQLPLPPQIQQIIAQHGQLVQTVQQQAKVIQDKQVEEDGKFKREMAIQEIKRDIEIYKLEVSERIAASKATNAVGLADIQADLKRFETVLKQSHEKELAAHQAAHEVGMAVMGAQNQATAADQQHQQGLESQGNDQEFQASQAAQQTEPPAA